MPKLIRGCVWGHHILMTNSRRIRDSPIIFSLTLAWPFLASDGESCQKPWTRWNHVLVGWTLLGVLCIEDAKPMPKNMDMIVHPHLWSSHYSFYVIFGLWRKFWHGGHETLTSSCQKIGMTTVMLASDEETLSLMPIYNNMMLYVIIFHNFSFWHYAHKR